MSIKIPNLTLQTLSAENKLSPKETEQLKKDLALFFNGQFSYEQLRNMPVLDLLKLMMDKIRARYFSMKPSKGDDVEEAILDVIDLAFQRVNNEVEALKT